MTPQDVKKIKDFIFSLRQLQSAETFPIGGVIIDPRDRSAVVQELHKAGLPHIIAADQHEDELLAPMLDRVAQGKGIIIELTGQIPPKISGILLHISESGIVNTHLAGELESRIINPLPQSGFIVLMMGLEVYKELEAKHVISDFCNVAVVAA